MLLKMIIKKNSRILAQAKGGSDLVWYSIDRDIFKTESIFCRNKIKTNAERIVTKKLRSINFTTNTFEIEFKFKYIFFKNLFQLS